jgi:hypothetical protein
MNVLFLTCAESAVIDQQTNKLSIFGILEEFQGIGFPGIIPSVAIIVVLSRKKSESEAINLAFSIALNGNVLFEGPLKMSFQGALRARAVANIHGVPITSAGTMTFSARDKSKKNKLLGTWSVEVKQVAQIAQAPAISATNSRSKNPVTSKKRRATKRRK